MKPTRRRTASILPVLLVLSLLPFTAGLAVGWVGATACAQPGQGFSGGSGPAAAHTPAPSPSPKASPSADEPYAEESWELLLVNRWEPLPEDYSFETVTLKNGLQVDRRCYPDLQAMMDACRAAGLSPLICSAYRSYERQEELYQAKADAFLTQGYDPDSAREEAGKIVAVPGTSEHQSGLAVDIVDIDNQRLDESQEDTPVQQWLMEHSWEYGFILRYPSEKSDLTGIIYEPWHYRYVGRENAEQLHTLGLCLEEYLAR